MSARTRLALLALAAPSLAALVLAACSTKDVAPESLDQVRAESPVQADALEDEEGSGSAGAELERAPRDQAVAGEAQGRADSAAAGGGSAVPAQLVLATPKADPAPEAEPMATAAAPAPKPSAAPARAEATRTRGKDMAKKHKSVDAPPAPRLAEGRAAANARPAGSGPVGGVLGGDVGGSPALDAATLATRGEGDAVDNWANSEAYKDHGVNPFTLVTDDALSTFSIDVDTASYTVARRKLEGNTLPPEAAVRVEEFINYFDYDSYVTPKDDPFAVNLEAMPDPFRPGHHLLRVGVQGKEVSRDERPPVHLVFLVDVSGSMSSADKLGLAKKSLHMMVDGLREDDTVGLATYAGRVARVLEPTSAANKQAIHGAIEGLSSGGSTAMSSGIDIAYQMAERQFKPGHENRVVILSDGDANVGRTSWDDMLGQIKVHADKGVTLSTIGFGMGNYQDTLMEQLANHGDGNNYYIDSQAQAQRVFVEELGGTMITIARDVKIQVEFNPESVAAYRLVGYENRDIADRDFRNDRVDAGEVGAGHNVTALYDVILKDGYTKELATVRMRYEAPGADKAATEKLWAFQDRRLAETPALASRDTRIAYAAATFAEVLRGSPHAAEIDLAALARFAEQSARPGEKDDQELISLMRKAKALGAGGGAAISRR